MLLSKKLFQFSPNNFYKNLKLTEYELDPLDNEFIKLLKKFDSDIAFFRNQFDYTLFAAVLNYWRISESNTIEEKKSMDMFVSFFLSYLKETCEKEQMMSIKYFREEFNHEKFIKCVQKTDKIKIEEISLEKFSCFILHKYIQFLSFINVQTLGTFSDIFDKCFLLHENKSHKNEKNKSYKQNIKFSF